MRELWSLSVPLMLATMSSMMMLFVDRLLLANYSTAALNAVTNATTLGWAIQFMWLALAGIAEVFVAQHNGAGEERKLGPPVWQMVWLGVLSLLFFAPMGLWVGD